MLSPSGAFQTFPDLVHSLGGAAHGRTFLPRRTSRGGAAVRFGDLRDDIDRVAAGLLATGVRRGDRIGLIAENRYEWLLADLASTSIGATDVPRGTDTATAELLFILQHSGCRMAFVETEAVARALHRHRDQLPDLETVCVLSPEPATGGLMTLDGLRRLGDSVLRDDPDRLARARRDVTPDDCLTIVYTSGTTADPKGVMLTHANVLSNMRMIDSVLHFDGDDVFLSILPAWHAYERIMNYMALSARSQLVYSDRRRLKDDLREVRPTIFAAVPRVWEAIHDGIVSHCRRQRPLGRRVLNLVLDNCRRVGAAEAGFGRRLLHRAFARTVLPRFRAATGGRLRIAVSGGGALPAHVDQCLLGIGVPLLNGYGLTETSPVACVRLPERNHSGTIGWPLPDTEIEIRDESGRALPQGSTGLIWIRGPQVMRGYYRNPERTAQAIDCGGWFNSGDLGAIGPDGQVRITGRAKDTIVLAGGENVEPERLEAALKTSPFIDQAILVGQDKKTLGAILVPALDCLEQEIPRSRWEERDGRLCSDQVRTFFRREIDRVLGPGNGFRPLERVASFRILVEPLTIENGLLTPTLKVKRHKVTERHGRLIEEMFA